MKSPKERIEAVFPEIREAAHFIHENPELGNQEFQACARLTGLLENHGFTVEKGICGLETAFIASYKGEKPGPVIGFPAEYDALRALGHAFGHNLIGTLACLSAIAMKEAVDEYGGEVRVIGSPAEETMGAKCILAEKGYYDDLACAIMGHPFGTHAPSGMMAALDSQRFEFFGQSAHTGTAPWDGINALNAVIETFNGINALRQHVTPDARVSGIIPNGGAAGNIVPDYASCDFYIRANTSKYVHGFSEKIKNCARGAALATGCEVKITNFEGYYDDLHTNETLSARCMEHFRAVAPEAVIREVDFGGSSDIGNVSYRCPTIHQLWDVTGDPEVGIHTNEFCVCADTDYAYEQMKLVAEAFVMTAEDALTQPEFVEAMKKEFVETTAM